MCVDIVKFYGTSVHLLACIVIVSVYMFRPCAVDIISCEGDERLVVSEDWNRCEVMPEIFSESDQPDSLC